MDENKFYSVLREHEEEINNNEFEKAILDLYKECGTQGVTKFKNALVKLNLDLALYDKEILTIIKDILCAK